MPIPHALVAIGSWIGVTASRIVANVASRIFTQPSKTSSVATQGKTQVAKRGGDQLRKAESDYLRGRAKREQDLVNIQADLAKIREIEVEAGMAIAAAQAEREERALEISERELQLKQQTFQLAKQRLKQEGQIAETQRQQVERALELRERELQILAEERAEKIRLSYLHLQILQQNKALEIELHLNTIQANWDQENWSGVLSRAEMKQILLEGREKPRLLMLVSPPDIEGCSDFDIHLHKDMRGELKSFIENYYPLDSDLCPVQFYGRFFKKSVFDIEVKQYEKDLAPIPTVIIYSDVTDKKIFFYIHYWGFIEGVPLTLSWNWREERDKLEAEGKTKDESNSIIRDAIVKIHQLLAAFWSDLYYLQVNPHHEVRLFQLDEDFPVEWAKSQFDALRDLQQQILENYKESLMSLPATPVNLSDPLPQEKEEITICFLGKTGSGKSTLINAFYNWCLGIDGRTKTERKYCITTRSQEGKKLEAEKQFAHLNTEDTQRTKGASSTKSPSRYTFETDELILHVVDTPGFADTSGLTTDREHMKQIIEKITQLNQVHIFGIVWNEKRLTAEQKFVGLFWVLGVDGMIDTKNAGVMKQWTGI